MWNGQLIDYAQADIIQMCGLHDTMARMMWAMDFDWRRFPQHSDPTYRRYQIPAGQPCAEPVPKPPRLVQSSGEEASFSLTESDSSDSQSRLKKIANEHMNLPSWRTLTMIRCGASKPRTSTRDAWRELQESHVNK